MPLGVVPLFTVGRCGLFYLYTLQGLEQVGDTTCDTGWWRVVKGAADWARIVDLEDR